VAKTARRGDVRIDALDAIMSAMDLVALAMDHHRHGRIAEAEAGYRDTLRVDPNNADALHLLGVILAARGETTHGVELITRSLTHNPDSNEAHLNLANIHAGALRMGDAERHFREVYRRDKTNADAANGLGGSFLHRCRYREAEPYLKEALALAPGSVPVLLNMGMLMYATGRFDEAFSFYDRALAADPNHADAHMHRSIALLLRGHFAEGWTEYAWRTRSRHAPTFFGRFPFPYWHGEPLAGRKILVWTELGPGDEILTATMIPDLVAIGATVVLLCSPRMAPLFARSFPSVHVIAASETPRDPSVVQGIAFQASVSELGAALRPAFDAFPKERALLHADPSRTAALRSRYLAAAPRNKLVGISWRSRNVRIEDAKSIPLERWKVLLTTPGITFVSLQYGDAAEEIAQIRRDLAVQILLDDEIDPLASLDDFAAQVAAMDLVISVSNTTVHIAGALGRPIWALVPSNHGRLWYWFLERSDSPWYPSARLFRQTADADWRPALTAAAEKLTQLIGGAGARSETAAPAP
jgi:Flp pilus assembly protein TadD